MTEARRHLALTRREYDPMPGLRWSQLKALAQKTPRHFQYATSVTRTDTSALRLGRMVHQHVLGGDESFVVVGDRRTAAARAEAAVHEANGRTIVTADEMETALAMASAVANHAEAASLMASCHKEVSYTWELFGVALKCRIDAINDYRIVELKTTTDASPDAFSRAIATHLYHAQIACYRDASYSVDGRSRTPTFVVVEKAPPYCVAVYTLDLRSREHGSAVFEYAVKRFRDCAESDTWPSYPEMTIGLPRWSLPDAE